LVFLIHNESKFSDLHYLMENKPRMLMSHHSEAELIQSCKVFVLTFCHLTVKCKCLQ